MNIKGKRILVTGSSGFIGRNLVGELKRHNVEVITLTDPEGHRIDVRDWRKIQEIRDIDIVYHLAAKTYVPFSFENPKAVYEVNVLGTLNILELCRLRDVEKIVFVSSYVYGQPQYLPIDEKHPVQPTNPYMRSKVLGEELCRAYNNDFGLRCIILRPFNVYGVGQSDDLLIPTIISQLQAGKIELQDSEPKRDFVYISDLISALIEAEKFDGNFEIFNIGYGKSYSVKEIVDNNIIQLYGKEVKINYKNERRKNEIMDVVADIRKARAKLGWEPKISIEEGLRRCIDWFKENEEGSGLR
jgi:UDP-glucose 4-epimerase